MAKVSGPVPPLAPHVRAALAAALLAALASLGSARPKRVLVEPRAPSASSPSAMGPLAVCPPGALPDGDACVPFRRGDLDEGKALLAERNTHTDKRGRSQSYEQIPRQPDRPAAYEAYLFPIPTAPDEKLVVGGYDLHRDDQDQRRGAHLSAVGHGGVDVVARRGTPVRSLPLEHQEGDAEIRYAGALFGQTVVTSHTVRQGGRLRDYVVLHGHLDGIARGVAAGRVVKAGEQLGEVGDTGSEGLVHLHLEIRQVRDGVDVRALSGHDLADNARTVPVDPRNLLPLR
ncbi:MAG: M23 family metallopeptidase [Polyangiaceae bacterium]|nr:M23 family metallopeptidase [Polyangiaceae bacterium]